MRTRRDRPARPARGAAYLIVLLVVLILTIVGLGVAYFSRVEDRTSGNIRLSKTAFYAAETGLRTGERALTNAAAGSATTLLAYTGGTPLSVPGGSAQGIPLVVSGVTFDQTLTPAAGTSGEVATFTLYVRNNVEDPGNRNTPPTDTDNIINLISVGQVWTSSGVDAFGVPVRQRLLSTKILEEQILFSAQGQGAPTQEGVNSSGTNTGQIG